ncbi:MAG: alpha-galactosidase [Bacteroidales bacterium]|nr:alpha-galactosidase [Bacteroidales bacterium]
MRKIQLIMMLIVTAVSTVLARNVSVADNTVGSERWVRQTFLKNSDLPFSFTLDGKNSDTFLGKWSRKMVAGENTADGVKNYSLELTSPDKALRINCEITTFPDFSAAEWVLYFTNLSDTDSPQISGINAADLNFTTRRKTPDWRLYTARGTSARDNDFNPLSYSLADTTIHFRPSEGRSSSVSAFPFYNLAESDTEGMCLAIGWSGTWFADFISDTKPNSLGFKTGMEGVDLFLYPGETIRTPRVAIVQWSGTDRIDGNNTLRRFMLAHHSPRLGNGEPAQPPLCMSFDYGDPAPCGEYESFTELLGRAVVERHRNFDIMPEVFWLDAGWYEGNNAPASSEQGCGWYNTAGSWKADPHRFPNGLKPIADDIHKAGAKFMVWFEPERVYEGTTIDREHPEMLIKLNDGNKSRLLNLGDPAALDFICRTIGDFIEENGIDYYRQDFNMAPAPYWAQNDPEGRKGITEIRHIEGLYKFWDYLLERFPEMLIDNCASGGRRLDLETSSRSMPLWRTDCSYGEPTCMQSHEYGLSQYLPLHGTGVFNTDIYCTRSAMSSAYDWGGEIFSYRNTVKSIRDVVAMYKELRQYYTADFYPLSGDGDINGKNIWIAWQFNDPADKSGIVQAFRRDEAPEENYIVKLRGIDPDTDYELYDYDTATREVVNGRILTDGYNVTLPQPRSSKLLRYRQVQ